MEGGGGSGSGSSGGDEGEGSNGSSWLRPRGSVKRNFSTMSASHREDSSDSLFLPLQSQQSRDPHYENEQATRRRRVHDSMERERERERRIHYPGDGLDFRRPVMSTSSAARERERSQSLPYMSRQASVATAAAAAPVIDLTDENEAESESRGEREVTGARAAGSSSVPAGQRLPRFGRDVIDVEEHFHNQRSQHNNNDYNELRPRALQAEADDEDEFGLDLPGSDFLDLPPRRSVNGRVQYSTLRRPARPPSPPQEMDDGEVEFIGARYFGGGEGRDPQERRNAANNPFFGLENPRARSFTPYPEQPDAPVAIDLTEEDEDDDDVQIVDERRIAGDNMRGPDLNAGHRAGEPGGPGGFGGVGRLVNMLRDGGAALGGRLAQRVRNFDDNNANGLNPAYRNLDNAELRAHRARLEARLALHRAERAHERAAELGHPRHPTPGPNRYRQNHVPTMHVRADGTIPGFQRIFAPAHPPRQQDRRPNDLGNLGNLGGMMMDYDMAAFDMGYGGMENVNRPPTPKYSPPPEAEEGFTRNPREEEVVVCPNCGDELAVWGGSTEEEVKGEIWVIKSCGHAYCGDCALHRTKTSKSKKGKDRAVERELPPPFKNCVVEGCGKPASSKSMQRVYFGS